ncbi:GNAT family N-acetyltransferase [Microvirga puerhi]|uniref:GNAT family N-acetyltransferase n=1 Tax=Microvirga puerhi TaxID=2876078 RepID=A0ABS7VMZ9_9HYPH|nr:GNAT family N-acetyltransferase [Microvirga puerhi]MBZ6076377.1 GNAT family N-acetyltransferase [Microvirga puerhi]
MPQPGFWRPMTAEDLPVVKALADRIHVDHPEDMQVFVERLALHRAGCHVLEEDKRLIGYTLSHPWRFGNPPALNTPLGSIPADATTYYVHDVALLPESRGKGYAADIVARLTQHAIERGFDNLSLVAVNGSRGFWGRFGFQEAMTEALRRKLASYGGDALLMRKNMVASDM